MRQIIFYILLICTALFSHPTGNIITANNHVLWSYVYPIGDIEHHACVMIWDLKSEPKPFIVSDKPASDFTLYSENGNVYIVENWFDNKENINKTRILKSTGLKDPEEIWTWFHDKLKIGSSGFLMKSDSTIIFCAYPNVYILDKKTKEISQLWDIDFQINKIKYLSNRQFLVLSDNIYLMNESGDILKKWTNIIDENVKNSPLNRNAVWDADYKDGNLLLAYWGKRTFELIGMNGKREIIKQLSHNFVPHWVSIMGNTYLLFSSNMDFENPFNENKTKSTIYPNFVKFNNGNFYKIW